MDEFERLLATPPIPEALLPIPAAAEAFLVGGALRNARLHLSVTDFDFATPFDPTELARSFARRCGGRWFLLDRERNQSRVSWTGPDGAVLTFDFAPFRAADLDGDLRDRDFTVNAIAISLADHRCYDPLQGEEAIARRELQLCADYAFRADPLRLLRLVRLATTLDFSVETRTWQRAAAEAGLLAGVAAERRGDELVRLVNDTSVARGVELLGEIGAIPFLFGPGRQDSSSFFTKSVDGLRRLNTFIDWLGSHSPQVSAVLFQPVSRSLLRLGRLRLALVLGAGNHDPVSAEALLALGQENLRALQILCPLSESGFSAPPPTGLGQRALARWADQYPFPVDQLLLASALAPTLTDREAILDALDAYLELRSSDRIPDLVDGHWIASCFGLQPGPQLGELVARLRQEELEGRVRKPDEARKFLILLKEKTVDKKKGGAL
ncbi:cytidine-specific tRNA nucleotidyltransferase [Desulfuromonas sp. DDH964]|uniref:hypothetical protein n=1 Tax=Desulfuromonas sp. DDH964 TaxID=1823759 RepID=UPI00078E1554|nr:hypothetical protein [Desulfuromonas sp. DDH964]AMV72331.1 cytidine-specific tRNA nucleotidyltransferase [Desulfuromonas sp. DDH964]